jgi:hypothetical protein
MDIHNRTCRESKKVLARAALERHAAELVFPNGEVAVESAA